MRVHNRQDRIRFPHCVSWSINNAMLSCTVEEDIDGGKLQLKLHFDQTLGLTKTLQHCGQVPLPPYISRKNGYTAEDATRYQTVYASQPGAVAAPTAVHRRSAGEHQKARHFIWPGYPACRLWYLCTGAGDGHHPPPDPSGISQHRAGDSRQNCRNKEERRQIWTVGTTVRALEYGAIRRVCRSNRRLVRSLYLSRLSVQGNR